jgi:hypothetical protein
MRRKGETGMTNNAKVGGILSIISGVFGLLGLIMFILIAVMMQVMFNNGGMFRDFYGGPYGNMDMKVIISVVYIICGIFSGILGIVSILGGVAATRKKNWGLALAGSITGILVFFPTGIPAVIFVSIGKPEFTRPSVPSSGSMNVYPPLNP